MSFPSARAKIDRAEKQAQNLQADLAAFLQDRIYEIRESFDPQTGIKTATYHIIRPIPAEWPIVMGEIVHNFRSALDHAITDLTVAETGQELNGTEFPIFEHEADYDKKGRYRIRGINAQAQDVIRRLQPFEFKKNNPADTVSVLALLHPLNILDKHRSSLNLRYAPIAFARSNLRDIHPIEENVPFGDIADGYKLAVWRPIGDPQVRDWEYNIQFKVVLGAQGQALEPLHGVSIIEVCTRFAAAARTILDRLEPTLKAAA